MKKLLFIILISISLFSCDKNKNYVSSNNEINLREDIKLISVNGQFRNTLSFLIRKMKPTDSVETYEYYIPAGKSIIIKEHKSK